MACRPTTVVVRTHNETHTHTHVHTHSWNATPMTPLSPPFRPGRITPSQPLPPLVGSWSRCGRRTSASETQRQARVRWCPTPCHDLGLSALGGTDGTRPCRWRYPGCSPQRRMLPPLRPPHPVPHRPACWRSGFAAASPRRRRSCGRPSSVRESPGTPSHRPPAPGRRPRTRSPMVRRLRLERRTWLRRDSSFLLRRPKHGQGTENGDCVLRAPQEHCCCHCCRLQRTRRG